MSLFHLLSYGIALIVKSLPLDSLQSAVFGLLQDQSFHVLASNQQKYNHWYMNEATGSRAGQRSLDRDPGIVMLPFLRVTFSVTCTHSTCIVTLLADMVFLTQNVQDLIVLLSSGR